MKNVVNRPPGVLRTLFRLLGFSSLAALALAAFVALRHMLETPQALESQLPGEAHLYRWKDGHIYYKLLGPPDAPPLVLLHSPGVAASAYEMRGLVESLARRFRVYAPDLPGFGLSDRPSIQYTAEFYTQICRDFLAKEVRQPALLVANRLSCNYAVAVAAGSPELCSALVLISPVSLRSPGPRGNLLSTILGSTLAKTLLYPLIVQAFYTVTRDAYYYATTHRFGAEHAVMALLAGKLSQDVSNDVERVQQPALVIWGADTLGKLQRLRFTQDEQQDTWGPKHATIELLPEGGLSVVEEQSQRVADTVLQWSDSHALTAPGTSITNNNSDASAVVGTNNVGRHQGAGPGGKNATPPREEAAPSQVEAYCIKCKTKRPVQNAREVTLKNGRIAVQGECAVCGTRLLRMGKLAPGFPNTPV